VLILAADTSTNAGSVALAEERDGRLRVIVERCWDLAAGKPRAGAPNHSDRIVPEIEDALRASGASYQDLGGLACAIGPGSFTGLRVALSALKGIASARALPLVGVSTLEAMAWGAPYCARVIVPLLDARKSEVYAGAFEFAPNLRRLRPDEVVAPEPLFHVLARSGWPLLLAGDGASVYAELAQKILGRSYLVLDGSAAMPRAGNVARLAIERLRDAKPVEAAGVVPAYLRRPEAEWKTKP
jgi:tRNA threonylcarbamoyladenosine biosynthesis protein TsaB